MRAPLDAVPVEPAELDEREAVCPRVDCRLVHWTPALPGACERAAD